MPVFGKKSCRMHIMNEVMHGSKFEGSKINIFKFHPPHKHLEVHSFFLQHKILVLSGVIKAKHRKSDLFPRNESTSEKQIE